MGTAGSAARRDAGAREPAGHPGAGPSLASTRAGANRKTGGTRTGRWP